MSSRSVVTVGSSQLCCAVLFFPLSLLDTSHKINLQIQKLEKKYEANYLCAEFTFSSKKKLLWCCALNKQKWTNEKKSRISRIDKLTKCFDVWMLCIDSTLRRVWAILCVCVWVVTFLFSIPFSTYVDFISCAE